MSMKQVFKVVVTGGPCSGRTTALSRITDTFSQMGWRVLRVPDPETLLLMGDVDFEELSAEDVLKYNENVLKLVIQNENIYFDLAEAYKENCLVLCERGTMDSKVFIANKWNSILAKNEWNNVDLRNNRYDHVMHMVTVAKIEEEKENETSPTNLNLAKELDDKILKAWTGHSSLDIIDNEDFEQKVKVACDGVCKKVGFFMVGDSVLYDFKVKFVVNGPLPAKDKFPVFEEFQVVHNYIKSDNPSEEIRVKKMGQNGRCTYVLTTRNLNTGIEIRQERKRIISQKEYSNLLSRKDDNHFTVSKTRRYFVFNHLHFHLDIYDQSEDLQCRGLMLLEAYIPVGDYMNIEERLPTFLDIDAEVTGDVNFSMYNLSLRNYDDKYMMLRRVAGDGVMMLQKDTVKNLIDL